MKKIAILIFTLISTSSFSQGIEAITEKISVKICQCIKDDISSYSEIKPEFNRCYDREFNQIFSIVDSTEQKVLVQKGALEEIKNRIIPTLNSSCEKIRKVLQSQLDSSATSSTINNAVPCPTNFTGKDIKKIGKRNAEIIAFNGLVTQVFNANSKPYYQVKLEGGNTVWIASLLNTGYEVEGNIVRVLGYVAKVENDQTAQKYNKTDYHILVFGVIDLKTKQMAVLPGSELQMKDWISGKIPRAGN